MQEITISGEIFLMAIALGNFLRTIFVRQVKIVIIGGETYENR